MHSTPFPESDVIGQRCSMDTSLNCSPDDSKEQPSLTITGFVGCLAMAKQTEGKGQI
jgi:hypothetical protein